MDRYLPVPPPGQSGRAADRVVEKLDQGTVRQTLRCRRDAGGVRCPGFCLCLCHVRSVPRAASSSESRRRAALAAEYGMREIKKGIVSFANTTLMVG